MKGSKWPLRWRQGAPSTENAAQPLRPEADISYVTGTSWQNMEDLGLEKQVQWERWIPRPDLLALMRQCDTFLFPSLRYGGRAVVVEAMAASKPVVCMDLAGPGMHIAEDCGIKVPPRSADESVELVAQALERLTESTGGRACGDHRA